MTTKRVVADDVLGKLYRKQHELMRRVMEGTLDPEVVLGNLQHFIEGQSARLPCEELGFTVSGQIYSLEVNRMGDFEAIARTCGGLRYFTNYHNPPTSWLEVPKSIGPKRVKLCLAQFGIGADFGAAMTKLETEGYTPADAYDLLAFFKKAPMFRTIPGGDGPKIYALGTIVQSYFSDSPGKAGTRFVEMMVSRNSGCASWELCTSDATGNSSGQYVKKGEYVLVRCR